MNKGLVMAYTTTVKLSMFGNVLNNKNGYRNLCNKNPDGNISKQYKHIQTAKII